MSVKTSEWAIFCVTPLKSVVSHKTIFFKYVSVLHHRYTQILKLTGNKCTYSEGSVLCAGPSSINYT